MADVDINKLVSAARSQGESGPASEEEKKKEEMRASMLESVMDRTARDRLGRIELVNPKQAREVGDMVLRMAQAGRIRSRVTDEQLAGMLKELKELKAKEDVKIVFNRKGFDESDDEDNFEHLL